MPIPLDQLRQLTASGRIFGVKFIKRTDGTLRTMSCRTGVEAGPSKTGQERNWDPEQKGLLQVWDMHKRGFRFVPADSVLELSVRGQRITL